MWKQWEKNHLARNQLYSLSFFLLLHFSALRAVRLNWSHPDKPSGIMLGYEVLRRTLRSCTAGSTGVKPSSEKNSESAGSLRFKCHYLQCPVGHSVCDTSCFHPDKQVIVFISTCTCFFTKTHNQIKHLRTASHVKNKIDTEGLFFGYS